jgi:hypothetical protein
VHRVAVGQVVADERVTHLVVGRHVALVLGEKAGALLGASEHPHDPFLEL